MPQSTPLNRKPAFVFGPPILLGLAGSLLLIQAAVAGPRLDIVHQQLQQAEQNQPPAIASLVSYSLPRSLLSNPASEFVIVNKHNPISPLNFTPQDLVEVKSSESLDNFRDVQMSQPAARALEAMAKEMFEQGQGRMELNSGFRSYSTQEKLFERFASQQGLSQALLKAAKPGFSEHQTGLAADISFPSQGCAIMTCFGNTPAGLWIAENSWKHGFIVRYKQETEQITGYSYEPWHLRFVGYEVARLYAKNGMNNLEALWGLPPAPNYLPAIAESTNN